MEAEETAVRRTDSEASETMEAEGTAARRTVSETSETMEAEEAAVRRTDSEASEEADMDLRTGCRDSAAAPGAVLPLAESRW